MLWRVVNAMAFWLLTAVAFALFAVAVLLPQLDEYRELRQIERDTLAAQQRIEKALDDNDVLIRQLRERDPLVAEQMARQRLNYRRRQGQGIALPDDEPASEAATPAPAADGPGLDDSLQLSGRRDGWPLLENGPLAEADLMAAARDTRSRRKMLIVAGVAIALAFGLMAIAPRRRKEE